MPISRSPADLGKRASIFNRFGVFGGVIYWAIFGPFRAIVLPLVAGICAMPQRCFSAKIWLLR